VLPGFPSKNANNPAKKPKNFLESKKIPGKKELESK
jgi:hypothetical protein